MKTYTCPMHPEIKELSPGSCPICHMALIPVGIAAYEPLLTIFTILLITVAIISIHKAITIGISLGDVLSYLMAGFFLIFSGFKFLDIDGFTRGYKEYDLLAKRIPIYGHIYPYIEFVLGLFYILFPFSPLLNLFTIFLMAFSGTGVALKLARNEKFQCVCLGTIFSIPLTNITLIEDFSMVILGIIMIFIH